MAGVARIERIRLIVRDLAASQAFYMRALDFEPVEPGLVRLGSQSLELVQCGPSAAPYPEPRSAADPWFQHFAIVVADMPRAYRQLIAAGGSSPISVAGPQLLPPSTGSVTAYKFRDPDGHPLELSFLPSGVGAPEWRAPSPERLFLGIDHSAIAVSDLARSVAFYRDLLGLRIAPTLVNQGPTQAALDGLPDPVVDIVAAMPTSGPHLELLAYRQPRGPPNRPIALTDVAATQLVLRLDNAAKIAGAAATFGGEPIEVSGPGPILLRDPDGHLLSLES